VLQIDALACPRCSTATQAVPMVVLAFLSDPKVVGKILKHLALPTIAPALAPARSSGRTLGFALPEEHFASDREAAMTQETAEHRSLRSAVPSKGGRRREARR
jgi:hypothetical protein